MLPSFFNVCRQPFLAQSAPILQDPVNSAKGHAAEADGQRCVAERQVSGFLDHQVLGLLELADSARLVIRLEVHEVSDGAAIDDEA